MPRHSRGVPPPRERALRQRASTRRRALAKNISPSQDSAAASATLALAQGRNGHGGQDPGSMRVAGSASSRVDACGWPSRRWRRPRFWSSCCHDNTGLTHAIALGSGAPNIVLDRVIFCWVVLCVALLLELRLLLVCRRRSTPTSRRLRGRASTSGSMLVIALGSCHGGRGRFHGGEDTGVSGLRPARSSADF